MTGNDLARAFDSTIIFLMALGAMIAFGVVGLFWFIWWLGHHVAFV